jgi:hypothetical protein
MARRPSAQRISNHGDNGHYSKHDDTARATTEQLNHNG